MDDAARLLGATPGRADHSASMLRSFGGLAYGRGDLVERRRCLLQARRLLLGAAGQVVGRGRDLACAGADCQSAVRYGPHRVLELFYGGVEVRAKPVVIGRERLDDPVGEFAGGQPRQARRDSGDNLRLPLRGLGRNGSVASSLCLGQTPRSGSIGFKACFFDRALTQDLHRSSHPSNVVAARGPRNADRVVAHAQTLQNSP